MKKATDAAAPPPAINHGSMSKLDAAPAEPEPQDIDLRPSVEVIVEIPRGSFLKRGASGVVDFVSPFPCPFNYGAVPGVIGGDGDLLDAVVLGRRLARGTKVKISIQGAIGFTDRGLYDDKLICSNRPLTRREQRLILLFFRFYALCKRGLNLWRRRRGRTTCEGWTNPVAALARSRPRTDSEWSGPSIPF